MGCTREDFHCWEKEAIRKGAKYLLVILDGFSGEDFPVYIMPNQDVEEIQEKYRLKKMCTIQELIEL